MNERRGPQAFTHFFLTIKYDFIMEYHQKEELSDEFATFLYGLHSAPYVPIALVFKPGKTGLFFLMSTL